MDTVIWMNIHYRGDSLPKLAKLWALANEAGNYIYGVEIGNDYEENKTVTFRGNARRQWKTEQKLY